MAKKMYRLEVQFCNFNGLKIWKPSFAMAVQFPRNEAIARAALIQRKRTKGWVGKIRIRPVD